MAGDTRVPVLDSEFNTYIIAGTGHLLTLRGGTVVRQLLGLSGPEMTAWSAFLTDWSTTYALWGNLNTRTKTVIDHKNEIKADFRDFTEPLLTRMEGSPNIIDDDRNVLNIAKPDRTPTPRGKIDTAPDTAITPMEGGMLRIRNRIDTHAKRASMHPLADGLEMAYKIGGAPPANETACPNKFISKKALFDFEGDTVNDRKTIYVYTRWVNLSNQTNNGPWSPLVMATISAGTPDTE